MSFLSLHPDGVIIRVHAQPKASKSEVVGEVPDGDGVRLKIRIHASPIDGEANEELLRFLKKSLKEIKPRSLALIRGEQSRQKDVLVGGVTLSILEHWYQNRKRP